MLMKAAPGRLLFWVGGILGLQCRSDSWEKKGRGRVGRESLSPRGRSAPKPANSTGSSRAKTVPGAPLCSVVRWQRL